MKQQQTNKTKWKEIALGEIFEFENKTGIKAGEGLEKGKYKFFTSSDNQSKFLDRFNFKGEHLIFSTGGKAGLHYCNEPFSVSNDCFIVRLKSHSTKFIYYLLKSKIYLLEKGFKGAGLKHLSKDYLKKIKVKLPFLPNGTPNLKEQERIVKILEENERQLNRADRAEELLDEYLKSTFWEMFYNKGFEIKSLGEISEKITDGEHLNPKLQKEGKSLIMAKDVLENKVDFSQNNFVSEKDYKRFTNKCNPQKGDLLLVSRGATIGRCTTIKTSIPFCLMGSVILIKPRKIETRYLEYLFKEQNFIKKLINVSGASAQQAIYLINLKKLKIPLPPLPLQQKFSRIVEHVEKMKENVNKTKQNAEELFSSLMQKAFRGEL